MRIITKNTAVSNLKIRSKNVNLLSDGEKEKENSKYIKKLNTISNSKINIKTKETYKKIYKNSISSKKLNISSSENKNNQIINNVSYVSVTGNKNNYQIQNISQTQKHINRTINLNQFNKKDLINFKTPSSINKTKNKFAIAAENLMINLNNNNKEIKDIKKSKSKSNIKNNIIINNKVNNNYNNNKNNNISIIYNRNKNFNLNLKNNNFSKSNYQNNNLIFSNILSKEKYEEIIKESKEFLLLENEYLNNNSFEYVDRNLNNKKLIEIDDILNNKDNNYIDTNNPLSEYIEFTKKNLNKNDKIFNTNLNLSKKENINNELIYNDIYNINQINKCDKNNIFDEKNILNQNSNLKNTLFETKINSNKQKFININKSDIIFETNDLKEINECKNYEINYNNFNNNSFIKIKKENIILENDTKKIIESNMDIIKIKNMEKVLEKDNEIISQVQLKKMNTISNLNKIDNNYLTLNNSNLITFNNTNTNTKINQENSIKIIDKIHLNKFLNTRIINNNNNNNKNRNKIKFSTTANFICSSSQENFKFIIKDGKNEQFIILNDEIKDNKTIEKNVLNDNNSNYNIINHNNNIDNSNENNNLENNLSTQYLKNSYSISGNTGTFYTNNDGLSDLKSNGSMGIKNINMQHHKKNLTITN